MSVTYEWSVETQTAVESEEYEAGEVLDINHFDNYAQALEFASHSPGDGLRNVVVLVRDDNAGRSWAYVEQGMLPGYFVDAFGNDAVKVPQRFVAEVTKHNR